MGTQDIGIVGLGVMGQNLGFNILRNGFSIAGYSRTPEKVQKLQKIFEGKDCVVTHIMEDFVNSLKVPRRIILMVPAGKPVDDFIGYLKPLMQEDDIIIDGGNSFFKDTERRAKELEGTGFRFIGTGISGGEEGALWGPSIMPGGTESAYRLVEPILTKISAHVDDIPCCTYIGPGGAGHFVKMVHNSIEYGDMQIICEAYDLLKTALNLSAPEISEIFTKWNEGVLNSYLMEITVDILKKIDDETGKPVVDVILDTAGQKGTGKWSAQVSLDLGSPIPTLAAAVEARILSSMKEERVKASEILKGSSTTSDVDRQSLINNLEQALHLSKIICYAQGMSMLRTASEEFGYNLKYREIAQIWKGGCIIRARLLESIRQAFERAPQLPNLLMDKEFSRIANEAEKGLRATVRTAVGMGVPVIAMGASLAYFDSYRKERLPANLLQGQRDYFGAHTYRRLDKEGIFHTQWL